MDEPLPRLIDRLAGPHGVVTRERLLREGVTSARVDRLVANGTLRPALGRGVYVTGPVVAPRMREAAAVIASPGSWISHRSAAAMQSLGRIARPKRVEVSVPPRASRCRRTGVTCHRSTAAPDELMTLDGLPVTTPARTVLDLAQVLSSRDVERAFASAERAGVASTAALLRLVERHPGHPGVSKVRQVVALASPALTRSPPEDWLLDLIRSVGLPEPECNVTLAGYEVDFLWRHLRVIAEVDGYAYHGNRRSFVSDRRRDSALEAAGHRVLRFSSDQIEREPARVQVELARALTWAEASRVGRK